MQNSYDYFVIFAEMRTGSNFLEENINDYPGLKCWGEVFNPAFVGKSGKQALLGVDMEMREADPTRLLARLREKTEGLAGFRFFHDHDPRILAHILPDTRCAKIILTRNPLESYVSRKIAKITGQWRLSDLKDAKSAQIRFERPEFETMLDNLKSFQLLLQRHLQISGQTAFYINYDDIQDIDVLNGLARFLGVNASKTKASHKTKVQNPAPLAEKVINFDEMVRDLASVDHFNLSNTPNFEPRRGPVVPTYVACATSRLLYMPVRSGPEAVVERWLANLDGVETKELLRGFTQKTLRQWKRQSLGHRSFTVISHPALRLHRTFCRYILGTGPESYTEIRRVLRESYKLPLPEAAWDERYDVTQHREAFLKFAQFIKGNLNGQTSVRIDGKWASQSEVIKGFADFSLPDVILREENLTEGLNSLAKTIDIQPPDVTAAEKDQPFGLSEIYDDEIEAAVQSAYQRDYMMFGFGAWAG